MIKWLGIGQIKNRLGEQFTLTYLFPYLYISYLLG